MKLDFWAAAVVGNNNHWKPNQSLVQSSQKNRAHNSMATNSRGFVLPLCSWLKHLSLWSKGFKSLPKPWRPPILTPPPSQFLFHILPDTPYRDCHPTSCRFLKRNSVEGYPLPPLPNFFLTRNYPPKAGLLAEEFGFNRNLAVVSVCVNYRCSWLTLGPGQRARPQDDGASQSGLFVMLGASSFPNCPASKSRMQCSDSRHIQTHFWDLFNEGIRNNRTCTHML